MGGGGLEGVGDSIIVKWLDFGFILEVELIGF